MSRSGAPVSVLLALGGVTLVAGLALLVSTGASARFDADVAGLVRAPALRESLAFLRVVTEAGSTWAVMVLAGVALLVGVAIGPWRHGVVAAAVMGLASIGNGLIKSAMGRDRPDLLDAIVSEPGYSFPSGHSTLGAVGWGVLAVLVSRTRLPLVLRAALVIGMVALIALIGISRVYLGVHYPTDVIAGWTLGGIVVLLYERFTRTVSSEPAAAAVDADPGAQRSDPPAPG